MKRRRRRASACSETSSTPEPGNATSPRDDGGCAAVEAVVLPTPSAEQAKALEHLWSRAGCRVVPRPGGGPPLRYIILRPEELRSRPGIAFASQLTKTDIIPGVYEGGFKLW
eukprot:RCo032206